ncbi:MAG: hypothetical protein M1813_004713 [Trichoglossum hirsutum]|nr:MAG: hypothetical protein M1813_004713 [Trichoglossum hirsutum]
MRMLQLAVLAERPLYLDEFRHAIAFGPGSYTSLLSWERSSDFIEDGEMIMAQVQSRFGGLLEVRPALELLDDLLDLRQYFRQESGGAYGAFYTRDALTSIPETNSLKGTATEKSPLNKLSRKEGTSLASLGKLPQFNQGQLLSTAKQQEELRVRIIDTGVTNLFDEQEYSPKRRCVDPRACSLRNKGAVHLIHETAKHFFIKGDGFTILYKLNQEAAILNADWNPFYSLDGYYIVGGHDYIVRCCAAYFNLEEIRPLIKGILRGTGLINGARFPFAQYAERNLVYHVGEADKGISQVPLLEQLISYSLGGHWISMSVGEPKIISFPGFCIARSTVSTWIHRGFRTVVRSRLLLKEATMC